MTPNRKPGMTTPRTEALKFRWARISNAPFGEALDFARQLETELTLATAKIEELERENEGHLRKLTHEQTANEELAANVRAAELRASQAVEELAQAHKYIASRPQDGPDYACAQCVPHAEHLIEGFVCAYHRALSDQPKEG